MMLEFSTNGRQREREVRHRAKLAPIMRLTMRLDGLPSRFNPLIVCKGVDPPGAVYCERNVS
jgi:hypothetical protein